MGRKLRTQLPISSQLLLPNKQIDKRKWTEKALISARNLNQSASAKPLTRLNIGDSVNYRDNNQEWSPAKVVRIHDSPRSYILKTPKSELRRNRRDIRKVPYKSATELNNSREILCDDSNSESNNRALQNENSESNDRALQNENSEQEDGSPFKTRSGRVITKPIRYRT
ncbi:Uncharacterised protein r2_g168 [Pycnogonum litorale]